MVKADVKAPSALRLYNGSLAADAWRLDGAVRHLNHGSYGAVPGEIQDRQNALRQLMFDSPQRWFAELPERMKRARAEIAPFIGVSDERLAFVPNVSAGATVVYNSLRLPDRGEVLVTDHGYGAVVMGARRFALVNGMSVRTVHIPLESSAEEATYRIREQLSEQVQLVILDHITSPTARRMPVAQVVADAHQLGARVLVDGAHGPGLVDRPALPEDAEPDFWVGNLHKWACAPPGAAVLVADPKVSGALLQPLIDSWTAGESFPASFDFQGTLDTTASLVSPHAVQLLNTLIGWGEIRSYQGTLATYAEKIVAESFADLTGESHYVNVGMPVDAMRLVRLPAHLMAWGAHSLRDFMLSHYGVSVAITEFDGEGYLRLSAHAYCRAEDYEILAEDVIPRLVREYARRSNA